MRHCAAGKRCDMENVIRGIKVACGVVAAIFSNIFGGLDSLLTALLICIVVDYVTGIMAAIYEKKLNSEVGFRGIFKKTGRNFIKTQKCHPVALPKDLTA